MMEAQLWLEGQLASILAERREAENMMRTLGAGGQELHAHREATLDLERIAARYIREAS